MWRRLHVLKHNIDPNRFNSEVLSERAERAPGVGARIAIFNHYDPLGRIDPYVAHHVGCLYAMGFAVVFMSTAPKMEGASVNRIAPSCWLVLKRKNIGLDIGGWPCAARQIRRVGQLELAKYSQIVFANDSVFGPLKPLESIFRSMEDRTLDIWGITESHERVPHLQSYFLVFQNAGRAFLDNWLRKYQVVADREELIARYEIGLSVAAQRAGLRIGALISASMLVEPMPSETPQVGHALPHGVNPVHAHWRRTLELGAPFIKRDLIVRSEVRVSEPLPWREAIAKLTPGYPLSLIEGYLETRCES